jgi:hypothetical protein
MPTFSNSCPWRCYTCETHPQGVECDRAPLLGKNLVRLLYLDEAGSSHSAPHLCVAGVLVHGDIEWPEIDRRIQALIDAYIPEPDRLGFVFHATDIFHGAKYFDRRKPEWPQERRLQLLTDIASIIDVLGLPVIYGGYQKDRFGEAALVSDMPTLAKGDLIHDVAAMDCLIRADRWLGRFSPDELSTVVHEDGASAKKRIKRSVLILRSRYLLDKYGFAPFAESAGLPLRRIIDTVHFADKPGARPLQLADLCAFVLCRALRNQSVPEQAFDIIWRHMKWMTTPNDEGSGALGAVLFSERGE